MAERFRADPDAPMIAALDKYVEWADGFEDRGQPDWLYVHTDREGHQTKWTLGETLHMVAEFLIANELAALKLKHIEKVLGPAHIESILRHRP
jgi:hypothetical protein